MSCFIETVLLSAHNIRFSWEIRKLILHTCVQWYEETAKVVSLSTIKWSTVCSDWVLNATTQQWQHLHYSHKALITLSSTMALHFTISCLWLVAIALCIWATGCTWFWYLYQQAAKALVSLCICTDSQEPWLLSCTKYGCRWRLRPK